jgi:cell filamentation protein
LSEANDPYLDPATGVLRNLVGARTRSELDDAEADVVMARATQLTFRPVAPTGDLAEFRAIHRHLFQDIYAWAGEIREVDLRKNLTGAQPFLPASVIRRAADFAADELRQDGMLRGLGRTEFIDRLSHHYDQWNHIHPFREGNGRTQRIFWSRVAADAGWDVDWREVTGAVNDEACRVASELSDLTPLLRMFARIVRPAVETGTHQQ